LPLSDATGFQVDDDAIYGRVLACSAGDVTNDWNGDDAVTNPGAYIPGLCCQGDFSLNSGCIPDDFCYNEPVQCEWKECSSGMKVFSETNGAMTVIHLVFFYFVVQFAIALVRLRKKGTPSAISTTKDEPHKEGGIDLHAIYAE
jgi:hypothetical protein